MLQTLMNIPKEQQQVEHEITGLVSSLINDALRIIDDVRCKEAILSLGDAKIALYEADRCIYSFSFKIEVDMLKIIVKTYSITLLELQVPYRDEFREHLLRLYNKIEVKMGLEV